MYFTRIQLRGPYTISLPKVDARPSDQFILKGADGLGPPDQNVSISAAKVYQGRNSTSREIVLLIGLGPAYSEGQTAADLRDYLYQLITPVSIEDGIPIDLCDGPDVDDILVTTVGYVSKIEINPMAQQPEVQITMECPDPYLTAPAETIVTGFTDPLAPSVDNPGNAPSGFRGSITFTADQSSFGLVDPLGKTFKMDYTFHAGDVLAFSTEPGNRYIRLTPFGGTIADRIGLRTLASKWLMLHRGVNTWTVSGGSNFTWNEFRFLSKYWGV